jgi:hypothetical protein
MGEAGADQVILALALAAGNQLPHSAAVKLPPSG